MAAVVFFAAAAALAAAVVAAPAGRTIKRPKETVAVTLPSGRVCTMARPAEGRPVTLFANGYVFKVYHDGTYSNVTAKARAKAEARPAVFMGRQFDRYGNELKGSAK